MNSANLNCTYVKGRSPREVECKIVPPVNVTAPSAEIAQHLFGNTPTVPETEENTASRLIAETAAAAAPLEAPTASTAAVTTAKKVVPAVTNAPTATEGGKRRRRRTQRKRKQSRVKKN